MSKPILHTNLVGRMASYVDPESGAEVRGEIVIVTMVEDAEHVGPAISLFFATFGSGKLVRMPSDAASTIHLQPIVEAGRYSVDGPRPAKVSKIVDIARTWLARDSAASSAPTVDDCEAVIAMRMIVEELLR